MLLSRTHQAQAVPVLPPALVVRVLQRCEREYKVKISERRTTRTHGQYESEYRYLH